MLENGFIKLHRSLLKWEWYDDANTMRLFVHLLLTVGIEDSCWHGEEIKRGSRIISFSVLSKELKLSVRSVRTALEHLKSTGEVTVKTTSKYSVVTVSNYNSIWNWYDLDFDYDEENDQYLIPEGWWEYRHYNPDDVYNNCVDDIVTHWMPLPKPPKER